MFVSSGKPSKAQAKTTPPSFSLCKPQPMAVLNEVCQAHGFHVDIPWRDLTDEQKTVILYGSDRIEIAFGKHTLESRMKWSGITARPRQTGYYGGIIPVMEQILKRDRNKNILRWISQFAVHDNRVNSGIICFLNNLLQGRRIVRQYHQSIDTLNHKVFYIPDLFSTGTGRDHKEFHILVLRTNVVYRLVCPPEQTCSPAVICRRHAHSNLVFSGVRQAAKGK